MDPVSVLVVDDSAVARVALRELLVGAPGIGRVETAADGHAALARLATFDADVVTLDVEMPGLDGLATLRRIMTRAPRPVIMFSAHTFLGADKAIRALALGAVDCVQKPADAAGFARLRDELRAKVVALAGARGRRLRRWRTGPVVAAPVVATPVGPATASGPAAAPPRLVAIGASTGGTEAIHAILASLPAQFPAGILIVQHMPEFFTRIFAAHLDQRCALEVKEAAHHDLVRPGRVLVARGGQHLVVRHSAGHLFVELTRLPPENGHRPSVDALFRSIAALAGVPAVGVILTGMGHDGAAGLAAMRATGAATVAQSAESCVVYGMPRAALEAGAVAHVVDLHRIPAIIQALAAGPRPATSGAPRRSAAPTPARRAP